MKVELRAGELRRLRERQHALDAAPRDAERLSRRDAAVLEVLERVGGQYGAVRAVARALSAGRREGAPPVHSTTVHRIRLHAAGGPQRAYRRSRSQKVQS